MTAQHHFSDQQQTSMRMAAFHHRTPMASWHVIVGRMIGLAIIAVFTIVFWWLLFSALASRAFAELYVAADLMHNQYSAPSVDGTWKQDRITGGSQFDLASKSWDTGLGYRFRGDDRSWTQLWSIELGYRNFGNVGAGGNWVSDDHYRQTMYHGEQWLSQHHIRPKFTAVVDRLEGGYLRVAKGFDVGYGFEPFISAGLFGAAHELSMRDSARPIFSGIVAGPTVGGGFKYHIRNGLKIRVSADSHWTLTESQHPISSQWITVGGGIEVPLKKFW